MHVTPLFISCHHICKLLPSLSVTPCFIHKHTPTPNHKRHRVHHISSPGNPLHPLTLLSSPYLSCWASKALLMTPKKLRYLSEGRGPISLRDVKTKQVACLSNKHITALDPHKTTVPIGHSHVYKGQLYFVVTKQQ